MCPSTCFDVVARFVSRPDLKKEKLPEFLDWCLRTLATTDGTIMFL